MQIQSIRRHPRGPGMQDFQAGTSIVAACLIHGIRIAEDACFSHHSALLVYFFLKGRSWRGVFCHVEDFILWWPGQCCRRILVTMLGNPRRKNRKHSNKCLSSWDRNHGKVFYGPPLSWAHIISDTCMQRKAAPVPLQVCQLLQSNAR